jgi:hypothetical protein
VLILTLPIRGIHAFLSGSGSLIADLKLETNLALRLQVEVHPSKVSQDEKSGEI